MLDPILDFVAHLGPWVYAVVFLLAVLKSCIIAGTVLPGQTLIVFSGFLAFQGTLDLWILLALIAVGSIVGNLVGYELGRRLARAWVLRHGGRMGLQAEHLAWVDDFLARHGGAAVLIARFSALLRETMPFVAGAARLRYRTFVLYSVVGGLPWSVLVVMAGYLAGASWWIVQYWLGMASVVLLLAVVALAVAATIYYRRRRSRR